MITIDELTLPADLIWTDEYRWTPVAQQETVTLDGALVVQAMAQQTGRPITLSGGENHAWVRRDLLEQLRAKANTPELQVTLTLNDGSAHTVIWTDERLTADPVWDVAHPEDDQPYIVTLYFKEVA
jgi:hypothetical protein